MTPVIYIVDDEVISLKLLEMCLKGQGYEIHCFSGGVAALERFKAYPANLVITDIFLPDLDGNDLTYSLKQINPEVKVIAVSGTPDTKYINVLDNSKRAGSDLTFCKPVDPDRLIAGVKSLL
ncbi:MAG: response regulator [SAR324 cluster bacterium]|nr:response regulator [SAR324 cluster bacterium]